MAARDSGDTPVQGEIDRRLDVGCLNIQPTRRVGTTGEFDCSHDRSASVGDSVRNIRDGLARLSGCDARRSVRQQATPAHHRDPPATACQSRPMRAARPRRACSSMTTAVRVARGVIGHSAPAGMESRIRRRPSAPDVPHQQCHREQQQRQQQGGVARLNRRRAIGSSPQRFERSDRRRGHSTAGGQRIATGGLRPSRHPRERRPATAANRRSRFPADRVERRFNDARWAFSQYDQAAPCPPRAVPNRPVPRPRVRPRERSDEAVGTAATGPRIPAPSAMWSHQSLPGCR